MATETSKSSVLTFILGAAVVALGAVAVFLFVGKTGLPSAEQNTLAQAQGPLPPPARLPTPPQAVEQMAPAALPTSSQAAEQVAPQEQAVPQVQPAQEAAPQVQRRAPVQPEVTRLPPAAASNRDRPGASRADDPCAGREGSDACQ